MKNWFSLILCTLSIFVRSSEYDAGRIFIDKMNARQIIRAVGFPSEDHTIKTRDGYLLEIHRIPHGRFKRLNRAKFPPIFFQHGLMCSSANYILRGANDSLPFLLADMGFDVWLGNSRGNSYSRAHATLNPDIFKFWNYTWHEAGLYDLSAQIDFVLEKTNKEKLVYIGHSMGTTMFFVLLSMVPEYNKKIELGMLMAPVAFLSNTRSPLFRLFAPLGDKLFNLAMTLGIGELLPHSKLMDIIGKYFCEKTNIDRDICGSVIHIISGDDPRAYDRVFMEILLKHFPEGYSVKAVNHYVQLINSGKFRMYNFGKLGNMRQYGVPKPPEYNLKNITASMMFYAAKSDYLSDLNDVMKLVKELNSLNHLFVVKDYKFGHLDFLVSAKGKEYVYDRIIQDLMGHLNKSVKFIT